MLQQFSIFLALNQAPYSQNLGPRRNRNILPDTRPEDSSFKVGNSPNSENFDKQ